MGSIKDLINQNSTKQLELGPENNEIFYLVIVFVLICVQEEAGVDV